MKFTYNVSIEFLLIDTSILTGVPILEILDTETAPILISQKEPKSPFEIMLVRVKLKTRK
jgi:hypothetical protein